MNIHFHSEGFLKYLQIDIGMGLNKLVPEKLKERNSRDPNQRRYASE